MKELFKIMRGHAKKTKGFTLFVALIVSSMLLAIGFSIGDIILKQLQLTISGSQSQVAFYAADSGAECAMYWDRKDLYGNSVFDTEFGTTTPIESMAPMYCGKPYTGDLSLHVESKDSDGIDNATTTFYVDFSDPDDATYQSCAKVEVVKAGPFTTINSRGYNTPIDPSSGTCNVSNARTVERGLILLY
jgi:hypothetical protein